MARPTTPLLGTLYSVLTLRRLRRGWRQWLREAPPRWRIALLQRLHLRRVGAGRRARNIVYLVAGHDAVTGGALSIVSQADEAVRLAALHGADVFIAPCPGEPQILRYTRFDNDWTLVALPALLARLPRVAEVMLHVPEVYVSKFLEHGAPLLRRHAAMRFHVNVMLQNIDLCPAPADFARLKALGPVTITTAHAAYSGAATAARLGCDIQHVSTWVSPEKFERRAFAAKRDLCVVSPDTNPARERVLQALRDRLPAFDFVVIRDMSYRDYRRTIAEARYALTFGEGLDGYFVECVFSGGIGLAVYNDRFFTPDFRALPGVYGSWDELAARLPADVRALATPAAYAAVQDRQFAVLAALYQYEKYRANLSAFYARHFAASPPAPGA